MSFSPSRRIYDLSLPLHKALPPWPGDTPYSRIIVDSIQTGKVCNTSKLIMSTHFATHMDAPYHFEDNGSTIENIPLDIVIGPALVHETAAPDLIQPEDLPDLSGVERILFKTRNSQILLDSEFHTQYVSISWEAAKQLVQAGIRLVGVDYFSVEAFHSSGNPVHHEFCSHNVILVEGLNLSTVPSGWYELIALPLKLVGADGSPCRAVLREIME